MCFTIALNESAMSKRQDEPEEHHAPMPALRGLFFTGTDTGVGKTHVASLVTRVLKQQGRRVCVCKPVATGVNAQGWNEDTVKLARAADMPMEQWPTITPWTFSEPAAPAVAARKQGRSLRLSEVAMAVRSQADAGTVLIVEGVGGLLCPLTENETVADLVAALHIPLVVVARRSLGTLSHTLLTLEVARARGLGVAGIVINETSVPRSLAEETNVDELRRRVQVPVLAVVPFQELPTQEIPAALAALDWGRLA
jgi:dethiobiotin synthetase